MPLISSFYGILIRMFFDDKGQHNIPHFHAVYNEFTVSYSLDGEVLAGIIPSNNIKWS